MFHNSNIFGSCIIHILYTGCAKIKKKNNSGAKRLKKEYNFTSKPHLLRHGVLRDNEYFSCAGEHTVEDPFPHCQWRGRGHVQRPPLYPTSEIRYDARGAERVRSVWGHIGAPPLYTSKYRYLSDGMLGRRREGKRIEVMSGRSYRLSVTSTKIR